MIGRVYRGGQVGGLLRYLYGPGRHNEHENPHLVAAWDLETPAELATLEPTVLAGSGAQAVRNFGPMIASLELATVLRPLTKTAVGKIVWHCPLRTAPGDRTLTDAEWADVARDVVHRTGIAQRGDDGGCRWVAVRHDQDSVHLVAVLARQDGGAVRIGNDYRRLREACRAAEQRLGLSGTAPADVTADRHTTRAEHEKAARAGRLPDRDWLREHVQIAALASSDSAQFLGGLRATGVVVRERRDRTGALTGYAVARPVGPGEREVPFGGGKLAPGLSLPRLQVRWQATSPAPPATAEPPRPARGSQAELAAALAARAEPARRLAAVGAACEQATALLARAATQTGDDTGLGSEDTGTADVVAASADVFRAVGLLLEAPGRGPLRAAARDVDRASRAPGGATPQRTPIGEDLRRSARGLARGSRAALRAALGETPDAVRLLWQLQQLMDTVRDLRLAQQRNAQAEAAQRAARVVREAGSRVIGAPAARGSRSATAAGQRQPLLPVAAAQTARGR